MAFLDNSGDIILDAVLTDTGRKRLARGDGSFNVAKFALGDDEINYGLYDKMHPSGTAYYDINILQTPVLEAFTNNTSTMKSKLVTISRTNLLYMPVLKTATSSGLQGVPGIPKSPSPTSGGTYMVATTTASATALGSSAFINGANPSSNQYQVAIDQGIDNSNRPATVPIDADLKETQYIVHMDNRLGTLTHPQNGTVASYSFLDDDNIATYYFTTSATTGANNGFAVNIGLHDPNTVPDLGNWTSLAGATGSRLGFAIKASANLADSDFLFDQIGLSSNFSTTGGDYRAVDSIIKIMGGTTGYSVEIPIRYLKKV